MKRPVPMDKALEVVSSLQRHNAGCSLARRTSPPPHRSINFIAAQDKIRCRSLRQNADVTASAAVPSRGGDRYTISRPRRSTRSTADSLAMRSQCRQTAVAGSVRTSALPQALSSPSAGGSDMESEYLDLVKDISGSDTVQVLVTTNTMLSGEAPMGDDHLFTNLLRQGNVGDVHLFFDSRQQKFHSLVVLGSDICGHPSIVHGGLTAAVIDEALGGLIFSLKRWKVLGPGPPFTKQLTVEYHKPLPANSTVVCTSELESANGRKVWTKATVMDAKSKAVYASGRALFVTPKIKVQQPWTILAWIKSLAMVYGPGL